MSGAFIVRNLLFSGPVPARTVQEGYRAGQDEKLRGFRTDRVTLQHSLPITIDQQAKSASSHNGETQIMGNGDCGGASPVRAIG